MKRIYLCMHVCGMDRHRLYSTFNTVSMLGVGDAVVKGSLTLNSYMDLHSFMPFMEATHNWVFLGLVFYSCCLDMNELCSTL